MALFSHGTSLVACGARHVPTHGAHCTRVRDERRQGLTCYGQLLERPWAWLTEGQRSGGPEVDSETVAKEVLGWVSATGYGIRAKPSAMRRDEGQSGSDGVELSSRLVGGHAGKSVEYVAW